MNQAGNASGDGAVDPVQQQFGAVAQAYATSAVHASGLDLKRLVEAAALTGSEQVLDLGCGAGHTALAVAAGAAKVVAIDITPEMIEVARGLAATRNADNVSFRLASVARLPFPDASFDLITSRYSAHHYADPQAALREAARVLRPGGRFLLGDTVAPEIPSLDTFYNAAELLRDISHVRNWRVSEWQQMFARAGFDATLLLHMQLTLQGDSWVQRMQTPPSRVEALKQLFRDINPAARTAFSIRDGVDWGWSIPMALIEARLRS